MFFSISSSISLRTREAGLDGRIALEVVAFGLRAGGATDMPLSSKCLAALLNLINYCKLQYSKYKYGVSLIGFAAAFTSADF